MTALTEQQIEEFDRDGFLVLRERVSPLLVERMRAAADRAVSACSSSTSRDVKADAFFIEHSGRRFPIRINHLHRHAFPEALELAGADALRGIAISLCGPGALATYEALVIKNLDDGEGYAWHRDHIHDRSSRVVTVGVYLTPSEPSDGALTLVAGSHRLGHPLTEEDLLRSSSPVMFALRPGDVVIHDSMTAHTSRPMSRSMTSQAQRLTVYFEYRSAQYFSQSTRFSEAWVSARQRVNEHESALHAAWLAGHPAPAETILTDVQRLYSLEPRIEPAYFF